ncbi:hypothetical protein RvY_12469 [Ramazzottius varieornatus]|uniref:LysM domain-containing protein n=1 Tax=Ramazzottius varieornatus TaxID=947166 RepID=A0A1D1VLK6_RAMVA|nr:hypothetical protein RvY_12469 [Ramazzottius varieornatus]
MSVHGLPEILCLWVGLLFLLDESVRVGGQSNHCPVDSPYRIRVRKNDCLSRMAEASRTSIDRWMDYNPWIADVNWIEVGWILCAPAGAQTIRKLRKCNGEPQVLVVDAQPDTSVDANSQSQPIPTPLPPNNRRTAAPSRISNFKVFLPFQPDPQQVDQTQPPPQPEAETAQVRPRPRPVVRVTSPPSLPDVEPQEMTASGQPAPVKTFVTFPLQSPGFSNPREGSGVKAVPANDQSNLVTQPATSAPQGQSLTNTNDAQVDINASKKATNIPNSPPVTNINVPEVSAQTTSATGSIDPNVVQCQFFDSGFANCWRGCTSDEFQYDVDVASKSTITMRQCIENKAPAIHSWLPTDGILPTWLQPLLIPAGQAEKIVAACTFRRDRSFLCRSTTRCDAGGANCAGAVSWKGRASEGDPLKQGSIMKGTITSDVAGNDGPVSLAQPNIRLLSQPVLNQDQVRARNSLRRQTRFLREVQKHDLEAVEKDAGSSEPKLDHDVIQCIFLDNNGVECEDNCSVDAIPFNVSDVGRMSRHECLGGTVSHSWSDTDGLVDGSAVLALSVNMPPADKLHPLPVAVCTFSKTTLHFDCSGVAKCDVVRPPQLDSCTGGKPWMGVLTSGHPLTANETLRGSITSRSFQTQLSKQVIGTKGTAPVSCSNSTRTETVAGKPLVSQEAHPLPPGPITPPLSESIDGETVMMSGKSSSAGDKHAMVKRQSGDAGSGAGGKRKKAAKTALSQVQCSSEITMSCLFMRNAEMTEAILFTCYVVGESGRLSRLIRANLTEDQNANIRARMNKLVLQRAECQMYGDCYHCRGYTGDFCGKQGDADTQTTYNECYLTDSWSDDLTVADRPPATVDYLRTCIVLKGWEAEVVAKMTCYEPMGPSVSTLVRMPETSNFGLKSVVDKMKANKLLRIECDFFAETYACTAYDASYCDSQWEQQLESNYWNCHAVLHLSGTYEKDANGDPRNLSA